MDVFEIRALMEIYEKSINHPNLKGIRDWSLSRLEALNTQSMSSKGEEEPEAVVEIEKDEIDEEDE